MTVIVDQGESWLWFRTKQIAIIRKKFFYEAVSNEIRSMLATVCWKKDGAEKQLPFLPSIGHWNVGEG